MSYTIRPMEEADIPARSLVHCRAWEETYRGLIPDAALDIMTPEAVEAAVRAAPMDTLVTEGPEGLVGFACFCPEARGFTAHRNTSEIAALYLLRSAQGLGLGRRGCWRRRWAIFPRTRTWSSMRWTKTGGLSDFMNLWDFVLPAAPFARRQRAGRWQNWRCCAAAGRGETIWFHPSLL